MANQSTERTSRKYLRVCVVCEKEFIQQKGKSHLRCESCHYAYKTAAEFMDLRTNSGHRPKGHKTRGIHKRVR